MNKNRYWLCRERCWKVGQSYIVESKNRAGSLSKEKKLPSKVNAIHLHRPVVLHVEVRGRNKCGKIGALLSKHFLVSK